MRSRNVIPVLPGRKPGYCKDPTTGCHEWVGGHTSAGYGQFKLDGRQLYAHRFYYERAKGTIPPGLCIDHLCRNRGCVNPEHMEVVTRGENVRRGISRFCSGKLGTDDIARIRQLAEDGMTRVSIARIFDITASNVSRICLYDTWKWVR